MDKLNSKKPREVIPLGLKVDKELKERVKAKAKRERLSLRKIVEFYFEEYLKQESES